MCSPLTGAECRKEVLYGHSRRSGILYGNHINIVGNKKGMEAPMGVIDKNIATMTCPECKVTETITALEKGSVYGSAGWGSFGRSQHFDVEIEEDRVGGPDVKSAKCKKCRCDATIETGH
jgi:hypothetical protein